MSVRPFPSAGPFLTHKRMCLILNSNSSLWASRGNFGSVGMDWREDIKADRIGPQSLSGRILTVSNREQDCTGVETMSVTDMTE